MHSVKLNVDLRVYKRLIYNALCERDCGLVCKRLIYNALCERECGLVCKRLIYNALCECGLENVD